MTAARRQKQGPRNVHTAWPFEDIASATLLVQSEGKAVIRKAFQLQPVMMIYLCGEVNQ
jgi:hypothetical protein